MMTTSNDRGSNGGVSGSNSGSGGAPVSGWLRRLGQNAMALEVSTRCWEFME
jgi:hypothetical protein